MYTQKEAFMYMYKRRILQYYFVKTIITIISVILLIFFNHILNPSLFSGKYFLHFAEHLVRNCDFILISSIIIS